MRISEILSCGKPSLSMEVFPPKTYDDYSKIESAVDRISQLRPDFMSVTYGAGGGTSAFTASIAKNIQERSGVPALAHLTCISSDRAKISGQIALMKEYGIENVLALRGDKLPDRSYDQCEFEYAYQLIEEIKKQGDFCIGGACYPESHPESRSYKDDVRYLKMKVDAGCSFLTTQMFFDNDILYNFLYRAREAGITVPIIAGIMPVTRANQIMRIVKISNNTLPPKFLRIVDRYGDDPAAMKQAGIAFASEQIIDLYANGVNAVHLYTMNDPEVAAKIKENISDIIK